MFLLSISASICCNSREGNEWCINILILFWLGILCRYQWRFYGISFWWCSSYWNIWTQTVWFSQKTSTVGFRNNSSQNTKPPRQVKVALSWWTHLKTCEEKRCRSQRRRFISKIWIIVHFLPTFRSIPLAFRIRKPKSIGSITTFSLSCLHSATTLLPTLSSLPF